MGLKKKLREIDEWFDWERVHTTMDYLDWRWWRNDDHFLPTIDDLKEEVHKLCTSAFEGAKKMQLVEPSYCGPYTTACGGFNVMCWVKENGKLDGFVVSFEIEEWSTFK